MKKVIILIVFVVASFTAGYYIRKSTLISPDEAKTELLKGCKLEYNSEYDILYVIVNNYGNKDFYKNLGMLEDHYTKVIVLHISQIEGWGK